MHVAHRGQERLLESPRTGVTAVSCHVGTEMEPQFFPRAIMPLTITPCLQPRVYLLYICVSMEVGGQPVEAASLLLRGFQGSGSDHVSESLTVPLAGSESLCRPAWHRPSFAFASQVLGLKAECLQFFTFQGHLDLETGVM